MSRDTSPFGGYLISAAFGIVLAYGIGALIALPLVAEHGKQMDQLEHKLGEDTGYADVKVTGFNPSKEDGHFYLTVTGVGANDNVTGENCEFIKCLYETDEKRFNELVEIIKLESAYGEELAYSVSVVDNLLDIVSNGKLLGVNKREDITYAKEGESDIQILDVSKPKIEGNVAYYYIVTMQEGVNEKGEPGYYTSVDKVHFTVTKEIEKDPSIIFKMGKDDAYVETVATKFDLVQDYSYSIDNNTNTSTYTPEVQNTNSNSR